jgi:hypothetical protein
MAFSPAFRSVWRPFDTGRGAAGGGVGAAVEPLDPLPEPPLDPVAPVPVPLLEGFAAGSDIGPFDMGCVDWAVDAIGVAAAGAAVAAGAAGS